MLHLLHCSDREGDSTHVRRCARALGVSRSVVLCLLLLGSVVSSGARAQDCIDYGDYIHLAGSVETPGPAIDVAVAGDHAYVADGDDGLHVVDVADPAAPEIVGSIATPGSALGVAAVGDYVFVADGDAGLQVVDVSIPTAPRIVGTTSTWGWGPADDVAVVGEHAFVTTDIGLQVMDVSDPAAPTLIGRVEIAGIPEAVAVAGHYACVVQGYWDTFVMVDLSVLASPAVVATLNMPDRAHDVAVSGDCAYVAAEDSGLQVVDISDPTAPTIIGSVNTPDSAHGVATADDYAYVSAGDRLHVVDISTPASAASIGSIGVAAGNLSVAGDYAYVTGAGLQVLDISSSAFAELVGSVGTGPAGAVAVGSGYAYVTEGGCIDGRGGTTCFGGLAVVDISDPSSPAGSGTVDLGEPAGGVALAGDHAYVAGGNSGLRVVDISNAATPQIVCSVGTPSAAHDVAAAGGYAYVIGSFGLLVVDISDPVAPVIVSSLDTPGEATGVVVSGHYAHIVGSFGLLVVEISDPSAPTVVGTATMPAQNVSVAGNYAYVAGGNFGLFVVDISDPVLPAIIGSLGTPGKAHDVSVAGDYAYVAADVMGLQVIDISIPGSPALVGGIELGLAGAGVVVVGDHAYVATRILGYLGFPPGTPQPWGRLAVCFTQCESTTPVELASYEMTAADGVVRIIWETSFEDDHLGFHVERAGEDSDRFERVSDELIRAAGDRGRLYEFVDRTITMGETYVYRLLAVDTSGGSQAFSLGSVRVGHVLPEALVLYQNHPNPFNPVTSIALELGEPGRVTLRIYDASGRAVRTLMDNELAPGVHTVEWDGRDGSGSPLTSGVYIYRLESGDQSLTRKLVMLK